MMLKIKTFILLSIFWKRVRKMVKIATLRHTLHTHTFLLSFQFEKKKWKHSYCSSLESIGFFYTLLTLPRINPGGFFFPPPDLLNRLATEKERSDVQKRFMHSEAHLFLSARQYS